MAELLSRRVVKIKKRCGELARADDHDMRRLADVRTAGGHHDMGWLDQSLASSNRDRLARRRTPA
jgi:hypothetical protein